jgi:hypothetical protein
MLFVIPVRGECSYQLAQRVLGMRFMLMFFADEEAWAAPLEDERAAAALAGYHLLHATRGRASAGAGASGGSTSRGQGGPAAHPQPGGAGPAAAQAR